MIYEAVENILQRKQDPETEKKINEYSSFIDEFVNFISHMLKWDVQKRGGGDEVIVPPLFLRNSMELGDAISILIKNSAVDAAKPVLRTLLENSLGLEYLLEKDTERRALSYIVCIAYKKIKFCNKFSGSHQSSEGFKKDLQKDKFIGKNIGKYFGNPDLEIEKKNSESLLQLPQYVPINAEYKKSKGNPNWYSLFNGPAKIENLAKHLELHAIYEISYRDLSTSAHASDVIGSVIFKNANGTIDIGQIRNPQQAGFIIQQTKLLLIMNIKTYIEKRLPERINDYKDWFTKIQKLNPGV